MQAATLAAVLIEQQDDALSESLAETPASMRSALKKRLPALRKALPAHPQALDQFESALG